MQLITKNRKLKYRLLSFLNNSFSLALKHKHCLVFVLVSLYCSYTIQAQTGTCAYSISGKTLNKETNEIIPFVTIKVRGTDKFTFSDENGFFEIEGLCSENNTLIVSCLGYCNTETEHDQHEHGSNCRIFIAQKVSDLEEVIIKTEKKEKAGTETIAQERLTKSDLRSNPTRSLADAVSEIEGVSLLATGSNIQLPIIHGLYGNRVLVINNGFKHGFQNWGTDHAPEIDINTAEKITVLKGAAGVRFGPEALGGAILIEGNPLQLYKPFTADIGTGYQTNGRGYFVNSKISKGFKNWSFYTTANYNRIGDRNTPDYQLTNTGKEEKSFSTGLRYNLKKWDFKTEYSYLKQDLGLLRASFLNSTDALINAFEADRPAENLIQPFSYRISEPNQLVTHQLVKGEITWNYRNNAKLALKVARQFNQRKEFDVRRDAQLPVLDLELATEDYQLEWKHPNWYGLKGLIGLQVFKQENSNNSGTGVTPFIPNYKTSRYSAFIVENIIKGANTFEVGLRFDSETNNLSGRDNRQNIFRDQFTFTNFTASLGYIRKLSKKTTLRTNLGAAWRIPNIAELYSFGGQGFRIEFGTQRIDPNNITQNDIRLVSDGNAVPEKSYKWSNEWKHQYNSNTYLLTSYANYIQNYVFSRPLGITERFSGTAPVFFVDQANALLLGADFSWKKKWSNTLNGTFGCSYLWSRNTERDEVLPFQPPITTNYKLTWKQKKLWKFTSSELSIKPSYTFEQFNAPQVISLRDIANNNVEITRETEIFDFKKAPPGYFLLDISWKFKLQQHLNMSITAENILNNSYRNYLNDMRYFADEQGRNFLFTINYIF